MWSIIYIYIYIYYSAVFVRLFSFLLLSPFHFSFPFLLSISPFSFSLLLCIVRKRVLLVLCTWLTTIGYSILFNLFLPYPYPRIWNWTELQVHCTGWPELEWCRLELLIRVWGWYGAGDQNSSGRVAPHAVRQNSRERTQVWCIAAYGPSAHAQQIWIRRSVEPILQTWTIHSHCDRDQNFLNLPCRYMARGRCAGFKAVLQKSSLCVENCQIYFLRRFRTFPELSPSTSIQYFYSVRANAQKTVKTNNSHDQNFQFTLVTVTVDPTTGLTSLVPLCAE